jgi:hypothetical protein
MNVRKLLRACSRIGRQAGRQVGRWCGEARLTSRHVTDRQIPPTALHGGTASGQADQADQGAGGGARHGMAWHGMGAPKPRAAAFRAVWQLGSVAAAWPGVPLCVCSLSPLVPTAAERVGLYGRRVLYLLLRFFLPGLSCCCFWFFCCVCVSVCSCWVLA